MTCLLLLLFGLVLLGGVRRPKVHQVPGVSECRRGWGAAFWEWSSKKPSLAFWTFCYSTPKKLSRELSFSASLFPGPPGPYIYFAPCASLAAFQCRCNVLGGLDRFRSRDYEKRFEGRCGEGPYCSLLAPFHIGRVGQPPCGIASGIVRWSGGGNLF